MNGSSCIATACAHASQTAPVTIYTFPRAWAFALALPFAALALMLWWDAWSRCKGCMNQRAHCKCGGRGDIRKPKWSDPRSGKKWDDD